MMWRSANSDGKEKKKTEEGDRRRRQKKKTEEGDRRRQKKETEEGDRRRRQKKEAEEGDRRRRQKKETEEGDRRRRQKKETEEGDSRRQKKETEEGEGPRIRMVQFKWILTPVFLTMMLQFEAAETTWTRKLLWAGREAVLSCENVKQGQQRCDRTTWLFNDGRTGTIEMFKLGQIGENARNKSVRLSLTESCSLVIKKVTAEDAGSYYCQQYNSTGHKVGEDAAVDLSVVTMTEQRKAGVATVNCSVSMLKPYRYTVKWLFDGRVVDGNIKDVTTSESSCSASVEILNPCDNGRSRFQSLSCGVSNETGKVENFNPPPLCDTPVGPWLYIVVAVLLVALLICVAGVARWRRVRVKKRCTNAPPSAPEADDVVSYASISFSRNNAEKDPHHREMVTYSAVRASPSSAHADPSNLYAVIDAPKQKR